MLALKFNKIYKQLRKLQCSCDLQGCGQPSPLLLMPACLPSPAGRGCCSAGGRGWAQAGLMGPLQPPSPLAGHAGPLPHTAVSGGSENARAAPWVPCVLSPVRRNKVLLEYYQVPFSICLEELLWFFFFSIWVFQSFILNLHTFS